MKKNFISQIFLVISIIFLLLLFSTPSMGKDGNGARGGVPGIANALNELKNDLQTETDERIAADNYLQEQIDNIELLPGPQGESGPPGPQGEPGPKGDPGPDNIARIHLCQLYATLGLPLPEICQDLSKTVFVTSNSFTGNLGGISGADAKCQTAADNAGLDGTYLAFIANDDTDGPLVRFTHSDLPYARPDGVRIADNWADLIANYTIAAPINIDENGVLVTGQAWTNVTDDGTVSHPGDHLNTCNFWTVSEGEFEGYTANISSTVDWGFNGVDYGCSSAHRLFCFEQ